MTDADVVKIAELQAQVDHLRTAIQRALSELGVPTPDYPAPVALAYEILMDGLT